MKTYEELKTQNAELVAERDALAARNSALLECLSDIQGQCIIEIEHEFKLCPELIVKQIHEATGLAELEFVDKAREGGE